MKKGIAIGLIVLNIIVVLPALTAGVFSGLSQPIAVAQVENTAPPELEPEKNKKKTGQGMLRLRRRMFTVNVGRFNKKIREKHNRGVKKLARYEYRLKKKQARKDARNKGKTFKVKVKRKGPSVRQNK